MVDFLKSNPFVTYEQYRWGLSVPMIRIMSIDNTRLHYLSDKEKEMRKARVFDGSKDNSKMLSDLGIPIFID